jgi:hypothetical protein
MKSAIKSKSGSIIANARLKAGKSCRAELNEFQMKREKE